MILFALAAFGAELYPVRAGETVESIAADRGDPALAAEIRSLNGLDATGQPAVGDLIELPAPKGFSNAQQAFLIALTGSATVTDAQGSRPAPTFEPLPDDATLCTGADGIATLRLASSCNADGSTSDDLVLLPETCLTVRSSVSTEIGRSSVVQVTQGAVSVATSAGAAGHVTIVTPSGITTGSGGGYRVAIEEQAARTEAIGAPVAVAAVGQEVALNKGQGSRTRTGEAPGPPVDLLPPGEPLLPEAGAVLTRPRFTWRANDQAFAYRFELATSGSFTQVLTIEDVAETAYRPGLAMFPTDGRPELFWRLSVFDRLGFQGMPSDPRPFLLPAAILE